MKVKNIFVRLSTLLDRNLNPGAVLLDSIITSMAVEQGQQHVSVKREELTDIYPVSSRQISRYTAELVNAGLLYIEEQPQSPNTYYPLGDPFSAKSPGDIPISERWG